MKLDSLRAIEASRVSAIIRTHDQGLAADSMQAAVDGGIRIVEFTLTTPGAYELIGQFADQTQLLVGAGTVMSPVQARQAVAAGARFLVSPIVDADVIAAAGVLDVPMIPGASTPTEMETAHRLGADLIKVFPAPFGGADYVESVLGPLPHLKLFPTAGVTPDNVGDFLRVGCFGVGLVKSLFVPSDLENRAFAAIRRRAEKAVGNAAAFMH